jgi:hypothetical protein
MWQYIPPKIREPLVVFNRNYITHMFGDTYLSCKDLSQLFSTWKLLRNVVMFEVIFNTAIEWAI